MYTYKHQWTKSTDNPRSKDQNRHFPLFHAHLELSFTLCTPTCLPSYSVLIEKLHIPTQTSQNLQHFGLDIIKTLQAPRGLKLVPIEENAQTAVILMQMYTEMSLQHSVLAQVFLVSIPKKTYRQLLSDPWHIVNFRQKMRAWTPRIQSFWEVTDSQGPFKPLWCSQQTQIPTKFGSNGKQLTWTG